MKKFVRFILLLVLSLLFGANQLSAQTILCVDRDFDDTGGVYTDTWPMIQASLDANGYTYEYWEVLDPADDGPDAEYMGNFDIVIWFSGEAWTDGETMGPNDEFNLLLYMSMGGGKLFLNAQDYLWDKYQSYGTFEPGEFPYDQLGIVTVEQDVYHIEEGALADSARFAGSPGSLAEGLEFPVQDIFTTDTDDGLYGDSIAEHLGQNLIGILEPYVSPGPAAIQYETEYFRSVFTTIDIAAISDIVARDILMYRIMNWLMYGHIGISDLKQNDVELMIKPNPITSFVNIGMTEIMDELLIFNNQGQLMLSKTVDNSSIRMDLSFLPAGIYIVKVKTADGVITEKLVKQ
ncbi:MAG: T9SS type A sorting domain-containing protein [Bacteroidota bacterium]